MNIQDRRAAIAAYKEQKTAAGIYAIRCETEGAVWVGQASNLGTFENRQWFTLRQGSHPNKALQAVWAAHDEAAFSVEILEKLDDDASEISRPRLLKERQAHWVTQLCANRL